MWNCATDERVGQLVNLHEQGLMLLGDFGFTENKLYSLRIHLPQSLCDAGELTLGVDCLWVRVDEDADSQWSGFQIIDASTEQVAVIHQVIACMALPSE